MRCAARRGLDPPGRPRLWRWQRLPPRRQWRPSREDVSEQIKAEDENVSHTSVVSNATRRDRGGKFDSSGCLEDVNVSLVSVHVHVTTACSVDGALRFLDFRFKGSQQTWHQGSSWKCVKYPNIWLWPLSDVCLSHKRLNLENATPGCFFGCLWTCQNLFLTIFRNIVVISNSRLMSSHCTLQSWSHDLRTRTWAGISNNANDAEACAETYVRTCSYCSSIIGSKTGFLMHISINLYLIRLIVCHVLVFRRHTYVSATQNFGVVRYHFTPRCPAAVRTQTGRRSRTEDREPASLWVRWWSPSEVRSCLLTPSDPNPPARL